MTELIGVPGRKYKCKIKHWNKDVTKTHDVILVSVDEDDCNWRFEDGSELSYDWHVFEMETIID